MKRREVSAAAAILIAIVAVVGVVLIARGFHGGSSDDSALAAGQQDVFSTLDPAQAGAPPAQRPWLGASITQTPDGPAISAVIADSPAEKAGLQRGDVVKSIDGTAVANMSNIRNAIKDKKPGDNVSLSITRGGNAQDVTVTLEARPEPLPFASAVFPELDGIPRDQLFSHMLGGSFQFKDKDGNSHTVTVDLGTVSGVDTNAKTLTVDLNAGGSTTYTIGSDVHIRPDLSSFQKGDHVTALSVDGNLRAVMKGKGGFAPFGGFGRFGGGRHGSERNKSGATTSASGSGF